MPHYTEESAEWQAAIEAPIGTRVSCRVVYDPDGKNIDLTKYLDAQDGIGTVLQQCEIRDMSFRGREFPLRFVAMGTKLFDRWNEKGVVYAHGWFDRPVTVYSRLFLAGQAAAEKLIFTGFLRSPGESPGGGSWKLVDQFSRLREKKLTNINQITEIRYDRADLTDPSETVVDASKITIEDSEKSEIEIWEIVFDNHPDAEIGATYIFGTYYVRGSRTGVDTTYGNSDQGDQSKDCLTDSGILKIAAGAFSETPDRGDRFSFMATVIVDHLSPAAALRWVLENHSDLEAEYLDTDSMDALDPVMAPALIYWKVHDDLSLLKIIEVICRHGPVLAFCDSRGRVSAKFFAPEYPEVLHSISKANDLMGYEPDAVDDLFNVIQVKFEYDWKEGRYLQEYAYPDDVGTVVADDMSETQLGNPSADKHGVERELELELPGFDSSNQAWLRFLCGYYYGIYSDGFETGSAGVKLHGLTVEPGETYRIISRDPQRDDRMLVLGTAKNPTPKSKEVRLSVGRFYASADYSYCYCDMGHETDSDKVVW